MGIVGGFDRAETSEDTEVQQDESGNGLTTFQASTVGTFADNPVDTLLLTAQQKNRAVTLTFKDAEEISLVLGATAGNSSGAPGLCQRSARDMAVGKGIL